MLDLVIRPDFTKVVEPAKSSPKEMLGVRRDGLQTEIRINASSLSIIQSCPRKAFYTLKEGWRGRSTSFPLTFGTAIHKALEVFYSHPVKERTIPRGFEERAELMSHGELGPESEHFLYAAIGAFVRAGEPLRALPDTDKRSIPSGIWALCHYFKTYIRDTFETFVDEEGPFVERRGEEVVLDTPHKRIILFGTIDFILKNMATGELLPGDHKTSSQMGVDFFNRIKPNHQYTGYLILASKKLGVPLEHFLVNGIQSKARPLTPRGGPPTFTRQVTRRTPEDLREFVAALEWAVDSFLQFEAKESWPIGHVDSCAMFGGCQYLEVCSAPNELRQNILEAKFEKGGRRS